MELFGENGIGRGTGVLQGIAASGGQAARRRPGCLPDGGRGERRVERSSWKKRGLDRTRRNDIGGEHAGEFKRNPAAHHAPTQGVLGVPGWRSNTVVGTRVKESGGRIDTQVWEVGTCRDNWRSSWSFSRGSWEFETIYAKATIYAENADAGTQGQSRRERTWWAWRRRR